jgi:membrane fusion protein, multidrug efflux system
MRATLNLAFENQQLVVINANEDAAKARVGSAEAALLSAKFALANSAVWAPIDGIVANRKPRVGEYVAAGTSMLSIVPINDLWVKAAASPRRSISGWPITRSRNGRDKCARGL